MTLHLAIRGIQEKVSILLAAESHQSGVFVAIRDLLPVVRLGWRTLVETPIVNVLAVLSIGIAIVGNTAFFSMVNAVFRDADRASPRHLIAKMTRSPAKCPIHRQSDI